MLFKVLSKPTTFSLAKSLVNFSNILFLSKQQQKQTTLFQTLQRTQNKMQRLLITHLKQASNLMHYSGHYKTPTSSLIAKQGSQIYNSIHHHSQPLKVHGFFSNAHFARKRNHQLPKQTNFEINQSFGSSSSW